MPKKKATIRPDLAEMDSPDITNNDLAPGEAMAMLDRQVNDFIAVMRSRVRNATSTADVFKAIIDGQWARRVVMLTPFNRPINPHAHFAMMAHIRKSPWLGYDYEPNTVIQRARNYLADRFLKTEAEWSWWVDQDTVSPFGHEGFFYATLGADKDKFKRGTFSMIAIEHLLSRNKTLIGGVYAQRKPNGKLVIQRDLHPREGSGDADIVKALRQLGARNEVLPVRYIATGCALIHRKVYEDIKLAHPELAPQREGDPWDFFGHDVNVSGEDIWFCKLAKDAGHDSFLDCGLIAGHLGDFCYMP